MFVSPRQACDKLPTNPELRWWPTPADTTLLPSVIKNRILTFKQIPPKNICACNNGAIFAD